MFGFKAKVTLTDRKVRLALLKKMDNISKLYTCRMYTTFICVLGLTEA